MAFAAPPVQSIAEDNLKLSKLLKSKIDHKFKPLRGLGELEHLALQLGLIQRSDIVSLQSPQLLIFSADHGVASAGISSSPADLTLKRVLNLLSGGAAVNTFVRQHNIDWTVVDAGLVADITAHPKLMDCKIERGTVNFALAAAMTPQQCDLALRTGSEIVRSLPGNAVLLGELSSGGSMAAATLLTRLGGASIAEATDKGPARENPHIQLKRAVILEASMKFRRVTEPREVLQHFGGFEQAMMTGAILQAASERRVVIIDGFNSCAAALAAKAISPACAGYLVFSHLTDEPRHHRMLAALGDRPLLNLALHGSQGAGAALAWPLVQSAARFLNEMAMDH